MAWITGLVTEKELVRLREIGWEDEDPPEVHDPREIPAGYLLRTFFVDNDVYSIMTGPDWDKGNLDPPAFPVE